MNTERRDPMREIFGLRDSMERLFQESFVRFGGALSSAGLAILPVDLAESEDTYIVTVSLPGVDAADVDVSIEGNLLSIQAETRSETEQEGQRWLMRERRSGSVQRTITLPGAVDADRAEARADNGILTLTLPKAQASRPRRIQIGGSGGRVEAATPVGAAPVTHDHSEGERSARGVDEDTVTDQSDQSFPASDPPSWTPERT